MQKKQGLSCAVVTKRKICPGLIGRLGRIQDVTGWAVEHLTQAIHFRIDTCG